MNAKTRLLCYVLCLAALPIAAQEESDPRFLERVACAGIERILSVELGTRVAVDSVSIDREKQRLAVSGLQIANPDGFGEGAAITLKSAELEADVRSLFSPEPQVRVVGITGPTLNVITNVHGSNMMTLLKNVRSRHQPRPERASRQEKLWKIDQAFLKNAEVNTTLSLLSDKTNKKTLSDIEMSFVGEDGRGLPAQEILQQVMSRLTKELGLSDGDSPASDVVGILNKLKRR